MILTKITKKQKKTQLTKINSHCGKDNEGKPGVKLRQKVQDGDDNVDDRWHDTEHDIVEQIVNARCATVDHT